MTVIPFRQLTSALSEGGKPARPSRSCRTGEVIFRAGDAGSAWLVSSGSVRLDRGMADGEEGFASLAVEGDIIGSETILFDSYGFTATALGPCTLTRWCGRKTPPVRALLETLGQVERRAAQVISLRCGPAAERVWRLLVLLATAGGHHGAQLQVTLPPRQDMADITALTLETVSRMVSNLRRAGVLNPLSADGSVSGNRFCLTCNDQGISDAGKYSCPPAESASPAIFRVPARHRRAATSASSQ